MRGLVPTGDERATVAEAEVSTVSPAAAELVIKVEAFSVNRGETFLLENPRQGWRPGKDVAGTVIRAADDGSGPDVGARVVAHPPAAGWAQEVAVHTSNVALLPDGISTETAAALPLAGLTALRLLRTVGALTGRRILITGASGGVGHYVVELAAAAGANITAVSASPSRGVRLLELGAVEVVQEVTDAAGPFDVVLESVGGGSFPLAIERLAPDGLMVWFGQASRTPVTVSFFDLLARSPGARIQHFSYTRGELDHSRDLATLVGLVAGGRLHPEIGSVRPWSETATVIEDLRGRRIQGNAVLIVD